VIGGLRASSVLNEVEQYDPATDSWVNLLSMTIARQMPVAAVVGNSIFAVTGLVGSTYQVANETITIPRTLYLVRKE
jgi:hypothetical protein